MGYYNIALKAGKPVNARYAGRVLLIDDLGAASSVDVTLVQMDRELPTMPNRVEGFKVVQEFDSIIFQTAVDCTIAVFMSYADVSLGFQGAQINVSGTVNVGNDVGSPVPVAVTGGVTLTASNVGINNTNAGAVPTKNQALSTIVEYAQVAIPGIVAVALVSDATLRRLRFRNSHASAKIAIGGAGVTLTNCPILLQPGDSFIEEDAAGAAWYVITDTPGATIQLQGLK